MQNVSARFLATIGKPQRRKTVCTITPPGGDSITANLVAGNVSVDDSANIRRRGKLTVIGKDDVFEAAATPGARVHVRHGFAFGGSDEELVSVFTGTIQKGEQDFGARRGRLEFPVMDLGERLTRNFLRPYQPVNLTSRLAAIQAVVSEADPGVQFDVSAVGSGGTITTGAMWDDSMWGCVNDLAAEAGWQAFYGPDGRFVIRPAATVADRPVWSPRGVITSLRRERPLDRLYNTVVAIPSASNGAQTWARQVAQVADPTHPRHPSKIGVVPYFLPMPTAKSATTALAAAQLRLSRVLGMTESLSADMISNPALEGGDVIRPIVPEVGTSPARIFQHYLDRFDLDMETGLMTLATRSQEVDS